MGLRVECPQCGLKTIPRRIIGVYVGSADSIKIWECRECSSLWSKYFGLTKEQTIRTLEERISKLEAIIKRWNE